MSLSINLSNIANNMVVININKIVFHVKKAIKMEDIRCMSFRF